MAGKYQMGLVVLATLALVKVSSGATHVVGDSMGWVIPTGGPSTYSNWASKQTFKVGDTLVFNFTTGAHTVAEVTKSAYDSCNTANTLSLDSNGPARLTLKKAGAHYYICTIPTHCSSGQKLAITATGSATTASPAAQPAAAPGKPSKAAPKTPNSPAAAPAGGPSGSATPAGGGATASEPAGGSEPPRSSATSVAVSGVVLTGLLSIAAAFLS